MRVHLASVEAARLNRTVASLGIWLPRAPVPQTSPTGLPPGLKHPLRRPVPSSGRSGPQPPPRPWPLGLPIVPRSTEASLRPQSRQTRPQRVRGTRPTSGHPAPSSARSGQSRPPAQPESGCQGSQVSMHVVRGSPSLFSSHGRVIGRLDGLKKDSRPCG